jgi:hypothetical protein
MLFNCDNQPDFAVLQIPTIILAHTALLPCEFTWFSKIPCVEKLKNLQELAKYLCKEIVGLN